MHLKKAAIMIIARQLSESDAGQLQEQFAALDINGDGYITPHEFRTGMTNAGMDSSEID
jgi:Ca2+-binding EF-hand superfamily protein